MLVDGIFEQAGTVSITIKARWKSCRRIRRSFAKGRLPSYNMHEFGRISTEEVAFLDSPVGDK